MVNKAAFDYVEEAANERRAKAKEIEERNKANGGEGTTKKYPKIVKDLNLQSNRPEYFVFLSDLLLDMSTHEDMVEVKFKDETRKELISCICDKVYAKRDPKRGECKECAKDSRIQGKKGKNNPKNNVRGLIYVLSYDGKEYKGNPVSPIRVLNLRFGKDDLNKRKLKEVIRKGLMFDGIFKLEKTGTGVETNYLPPEFIPFSAADIMIEADELLVRKAPDYVRDFYAKKTEDQIAHILFAGKRNVWYEAFDLKEPDEEDLNMFPPEPESGKKEELKTTTKSKDTDSKVPF